MVVDTSAVIAIISYEPEWPELSRIAAGDPLLAMSAISVHEASIVIARMMKDPRGARLVDDFINELNVEVVPVDLDGARAARAAYFRFGKGFHGAGLNLADCFPYALARARDETLLFKGDDFLKTDIVPAWRP